MHYLKWIRQRDGGVVRAVIDLASLMADAGDQVTILTCDDADVPVLSPHAGVRVVRLNLIDPIARLRGRCVQDAEADTPTQFLDSASKRIVRQTLKDANIAHLHGVWTTSTWQVARIARQVPIPYVVSAHGMLDDWSIAQGSRKKQLHLRLISGHGLRAAHAVHCTAIAEAQQVARNVHGVHTHVAALPFDASPFLAQDRVVARDELRRRFAVLAELDPQAPLVAFMSRLNVKKGVVPLIQAWDRVVVDEQSPAPLLAIAGPFDPPDYEATVRAAIDASAARDRIHLLGMVSGMSRTALLAGADLLALPTSQENFGYVLLEAMASATPVLTTKCVDIWPEISSSGGCSLIEPRSEEIARAITSVLGNRPALHASGVAARAWAKTYADPAPLAQRYRGMYLGQATS